MSGSRFRIVPNPPAVGQACEVTYVGPAAEVSWQVDDGAPVRVRPGRDGKFRIDPVPQGSELMLSDGRGVPGYLYTEIVSLVRGK
jgi:hypothetical protein